VPTREPDEEIPSDPGADPFATTAIDARRGGDAYTRFLEAFRSLQDAVARSDPPVEVWDDLTAVAEEAAERLEPFGANEREQPAGSRLDLPGRGNPMLVPMVMQEETRDRMAAEVTFRRFHLGGNAAAHGGTIALVFDEALGRQANIGHRTMARTAYIKVNYRNVARIDVPLHLEATVDWIDGRKRFLTGRLFDGETLVADAEGLFVALRPGQP
jgi:acyl-coenzyme A thioesterase PaaI-like protein